MWSENKKKRFTHLTNTIHSKCTTQESFNTPTLQKPKKSTNSHGKIILSRYSSNRDPLTEKYILQSMKKRENTNIVYSFQYGDLHKQHSLSQLQSKKRMSPHDISMRQHLMSSTSSDFAPNKNEGSVSVRDKVTNYLHSEEEVDLAWEGYLDLRRHFERVTQDSIRMTSLMKGGSEARRDERKAIAQEFASRDVKRIVFGNIPGHAYATRNISTAFHPVSLGKLDEHGNSKGTSESIVLTTMKSNTDTNNGQSSDRGNTSRSEQPKQFLIRKTMTKPIETADTLRATNTNESLDELTARSQATYHAFTDRSGMASRRGEEPKVSDSNAVQAAGKKDLIDKPMNIEVMMKFAGIIKRCAAKLKTHHLTLEEAIERRIFMTKPFGRQGAEEFIKACRDGDYDQVSALLSRNKYLLFDFDWTNLTGLHWAVIRGHDLIVEYLIRRKADVNARDVAGKTPLIFAARGGNLELVKFLLKSGADPRLKSDGKKMASDYTTDPKIQFILNMAAAAMNREEIRVHWSRLNTLKKQKSISSKTFA